MQNIYRIARYIKGLDTQTASIELGVSLRTLMGWELDERFPSSYMVKKMAKVYEAEWLMYYHLALNDDSGRMIFPRPSIEDIHLYEKSPSRTVILKRANIKNT